MPIQIDCFKAYDIRGKIADQLNNDIAYCVGNATVECLEAKSVVLGRDIRLSSEEMANAVAAGIREAGADVVDIGFGGTESVSHAPRSTVWGGCSAYRFRKLAFSRISGVIDR